MHVSTILKEKGTSVFSIKPQASLAEAADLMTSKRIGSVVVTDQTGRLCGILSERDIVRALSTVGLEAMSMPLSDQMTASVHTCTRDETVDRLMELMTERRIRHVPVIEDDRLIGLVSIGDVVKHRLAETEMEARAMREYISANQ